MGAPETALVTGGHLRFEDLRAFLARADELGMLRVVEGAHWNLEIGAISELMNDIPDNPILLFDKIPDYAPGFRVLTNHLNTAKKVALVRGLPVDAHPGELLHLWSQRRKEFQPVPPVVVSSGPVLENVITGDKIDLLRFPVPKWRLLDDGRYVGTGNVFINRDPEAGWVNLGTYRQCVIARDRATVYIEPHHHGLMIAKKYWSQGRSCPVAVCYGAEEAVFEAAAVNLPPGVSEYDYAGWLRGTPVPVLEGKLTGLPIPANAEIVIEGEIPPLEEESHPEGPFREWPGYYSQSPVPAPVIRVQAIYHRHNPILMGRPAQSRTMNPPAIPDAAISAMEALQRAGIPGVRGAWIHMGSLFIVVAIEQQYAGHSKSALAALAGTRTSASANRFYIVVDEDIDPIDINQVLWALCTRVEFSQQVDVLRGMRTGGIDPLIAPEKRAVRDYTASIMLIDACKPFVWKDQFGKSMSYTEDYLRNIRTKWGSSLGF